MRKGLALITLLLLTSASWLPLVNAQDDPDHGFSEDLGNELGAFGRGYVENLVLYSGAGVGLVWGPSFDGNDSNLTTDDREIALTGPGIPPEPTLMFPSDITTTITDPNGNPVQVTIDVDEVIALTGLEESARFKDRLLPLWWEETIDSR